LPQPAAAAEPIQVDRFLFRTQPAGSISELTSLRRRQNGEERQVANDKVALVIGAGDATGGAIARRFAREGYVACVTRRHADKLASLVGRIESEGGKARAFGSDARKEEEMAALVATIEREVGPIEVAVFNIGANVRFPVRETTSRVYFKVWEMGCFAGFLMGREVAKVMVPRGHGTILYTGATASVRGSAGFSAFSGAKHALRALAQSMARELGPEGIHVAHVVIDGAIDTEFIRSNFPQRYALKERDGILDPDAIAEAYWQLHGQHRSAWTHELDLRPWMEAW
jgi:NAD(P)-dependent dehydrogenase (short-subunit alcohol dehydrogenase family)